MTALRSEAGPAPPPRSIRLRNRLAVRVGLLTAALAGVIGSVTYLYVRDALIEEVEHSARDQVGTNALVLRSALRTTDVDEVTLLSSLRPNVRASELLYTDDSWFTASLRIQPADLPAELVDLVATGRSARQTLIIRGDPVLAVGTPLGGDDLYFEVVSLTGVEQTLSTLRTGLVAVGSMASVVGAGLALLVGRSILSPFEEISRAAADLAAGDLGARLAHRPEEELEQIISSFNRMADSLQERIGRESRFAADVSHELRSPLTTVVNAVSVLERRRDELSEDGREALDLLVADVNRFERTIADLIEIAKLDAGSLPERAEEQDLEQATTTILRRLRRSDIPVVTGQGAKGARVRIEMRRLELAMDNVLRNADQYAGGATRVLIEVDGTNGRLLIDDAGPGVPVEERGRIFERFARGRHGIHQSTPEGSGLGLSLVRELMRSMGGGAWVTDRLPETGTRFVLEIPRSDR